MKPNFFLVGGAKCGTTSLANYLACHPNVFLPEEKEPDFFYPGGKVRDLTEYEAIFENADAASHMAVGEASVRYLASPTALRSASDYAGPSSKFIVIVRNPVDMARSLHAQRLFTSNENIQNFENAWNAQEKRRETGYAWPANWYTPEINLYGEFCKIGTQLSQLIQIVGASRVLVLFLDDLSANPKAVWRQTQQFLGVPDDQRDRFEVFNRRKSVRSHRLNNLINSLGKFRERTPLRRRSFGVLRALKSMNRTTESLHSDDLAFRRRLDHFFSDEVALIESLTGRDLSAWRLQ